MSVVSCEGSALIPPMLPPANSITAVGSVITPTLLTGVATASNTYDDAFTPFTLPKGVWLMTGTLSLSATAGQTISASVIHCRLDGATNQGQLASNYPAVITQGASFSFIMTSDGTNVVDLATTATTSAGTWSIVASISSFIRFVKIA